LNQKPLDLLTGQHLHFAGFFGRQFTADGGIHTDQALLHCLLQRGPAVGVASTDHSVRQAFAVVLRMEEPPVLFQSGVELLQVVLCQLIQRDVTQFRDDMQVDPVFISCTGGSPEFRLGVVLIPEVHPISEGHFGLDFIRLGWSVLFL
jgi:hypothetical protein